MMKRTALLLLAVCTLLATAACAKNETEQPSGTLKATNDAVDFYFYYPDTWQVYLDTGMIAVKPTPSSSGIVGTSISVSAFELDGEAAGQGVNDYWDSYKGTLEKTFSDYALEGESELKLDGVPCRPQGIQRLPDRNSISFRAGFLHSQRDNLSNHLHRQ